MVCVCDGVCVREGVVCVREYACQSVRESVCIRVCVCVCVCVRAFPRGNWTVNMSPMF